MKYLLLISCVLLSAIIFYQVKYYSEVEYNLNANATTPRIDTADAGNPSKLKSIRAYAQIIERPLFAINRKPPKILSQLVEASIDISELQDLVIYGVVKSGDVNYAIVGNMDGDKETKQIKVGRNYKGWRVIEITSDSVKFEGEEIEYELFISPNESTKKSGIKITSSRSKNLNKPVNIDNSVTQSKRSKSSGGLIYNRYNRKKSPIKIPSSNQLGNQKPISKEKLDELSEEGAYEFDLDEVYEGEDFEDEDYYEE